MTTRVRRRSGAVYPHRVCGTSPASGRLGLPRLLGGGTVQIKLYPQTAVPPRAVRRRRTAPDTGYRNRRQKDTVWQDTTVPAYGIFAYIRPRGICPSLLSVGRSL